MDELRLLTREERRRAYDEVLREAFPRAELKPLRAMERMIAAGEYEFLGLLRDGAPVCYFCNWLNGDSVLVDYFCVPRARRCGGIGSGAFARMMTRYPSGTMFLVESEAETGNAERDGLILRRQGFYRRLGGQRADYDCALFGVHYAVFAWGADGLATEEIIRRHDGFYRKNFPKMLYAAAVQLPLKPGERPFPMRDWSERPDEE